MVGDAPAVESFTIITTIPNDLAAQVHDRMPVIVYPECYDAWLTSNDWKYAEDALVPYDAGAMTVQRVNPIVNNARNETEKCIEPCQ